MKYIRVGSPEAKPVKGYKRFLATKRCSVCGPKKGAKLLREFYPRGGTGVLQSRCKACTKQAAMESKRRRATVGPTPFSRCIEV